MKRLSVFLVFVIITDVRTADRPTDPVSATGVTTTAVITSTATGSTCGAGNYGDGGPASRPARRTDGSPQPPPDSRTDRPRRRRRRRRSPVDGGATVAETKRSRGGYRPRTVGPKSIEKFALTAVKMFIEKLELAVYLSLYKLKLIYNTLIKPMISF